MILAFLVALAVYFYITAQQRQEFAIAVANSDIAAGQRVTAGSFRSVQVNLPSDQLNRLLSFDDVSQFDGYVTTSALSNGDVVLKSGLRAESATDGLRAMSVPIDKTRAVGGALSVGDRVDVISANEAGVATFSARNLQVIAVQDGQGGALSGSSTFSITVAVAPADASAISNAINNGKFDVVRSTGATPLAAGTTPTTVAS